MRLFLAIDLPKEVKQSIATQLAPLKSEYPDFRWVDESRYHITLHFFGERDDPEKVIERVSTAVYAIDPFRMYSGQASLFMKNTIILHITFQRNRMIERLASQVQDAFNENKAIRYIPHLTIARYRIPSKQQYLLIKKKVGRLNLDVEFDVTQITLFNSVIKSEKPLYETIAEIPLEKHAP